MVAITRTQRNKSNPVPLILLDSGVTEQFGALSNSAIKVPLVRQIDMQF